MIDTEVHVVYRAWRVETNTAHRLVEGITSREHSGDLLIEEMDRAGVHQAFLIGYDGYDFEPYMRRFDSSPDEFFGGRAYTLHYARKYPDRFHYFTTLRDPRHPASFDRLRDEVERGAVGIKIFPNYLGVALDGDDMIPVYELCAEHRLKVIIGLEDTDPPRTNSHQEYFSATARILKRHPELRFQFNHGGAVHLPSPEADALFELARGRANVFVSTSYLGGPMLNWKDEWRYPFPEYLRQLEVLYRGVGPEQLVWATDWPWLEEWTKYPQLLDSVRDHGNFMREGDLAAFLGGNAERYMRG
ncbi:MAG: amidohydrolase family protein [Actinomycetota bacterium]